MQISSLGVVYLGCLLSINYHRNEMRPCQLNPQVRTNMALKLHNYLYEYVEGVSTPLSPFLTQQGQNQECIGINLADMIREAVMRTKPGQSY